MLRATARKRRLNRLEDAKCASRQGPYARSPALARAAKTCTTQRFYLRPEPKPGTPPQLASKEYSPGKEKKMGFGKASGKR